MRLDKVGEVRSAGAAISAKGLHDDMVEKMTYRRRVRIPAEPTAKYSPLSLLHVGPPSLCC